MPHRGARLPLIAYADCSDDRLVLASLRSLCMAAEPPRCLVCEMDACSKLPQKHRRHLLKQDILAGSCDREVKPVIRKDISHVPIGLLEGGLDRFEAPPCPAS